MIFEIEGQQVTYSTDKFSAGFSRILEVPKGAINTRIVVENEIWLGRLKSFRVIKDYPLSHN